MWGRTILFRMPWTLVLDCCGKQAPLLRCDALNSLQCFAVPYIRNLSGNVDSPGLVEGPEETKKQLPVHNLGEQAEVEWKRCSSEFIQTTPSSHELLLVFGQLCFCLASSDAPKSPHFATVMC